MEGLHFPNRLLLALILLGFSLGSLGFDQSRTGKLFSLFNVVRFKNDPCAAASGNGLTGTCYTSTECAACGGIPNGNCAAGFGVCCIIIRTGCGADVDKNCTLIQSEGFPLTDQDVGQCNYRFRSSELGIAQVRLDFLNTVLSVGDGALGNPGQCGNAQGGNVANNVDVMTFRSPVGRALNQICGTLTGQHIYIDSDVTDGTLAEMTIEKNTPMFARRYQIKVTYIEANNLSRAPMGCTQYFTGLSDTIMSYNFVGRQLLENQLYSNCIRQEQGFCSYSVTQVDAMSFQLSKVAASQLNCKTNNHIIIPRPASVSFNQAGKVLKNTDMNCGSFLDDSFGSKMPGIVMSDEVIPFAIGVRTLRSQDRANGKQQNMLKTALKGFAGFNIKYTQNPFPFAFISFTYGIFE